MKTRGDPADPKGLIRESYRIEGISDGECRSILMDWALSLADEADQKAMISVLLERHGPGAPDHPMTALLRAGADRIAHGGRRGGWRGRARPDG